MDSLPSQSEISLQNKLLHELDDAEAKAWDALARYKFWMFGYYAGRWVYLNRVAQTKRSNPWKPLVDIARTHAQK